MSASCIFIYSSAKLPLRIARQSRLSWSCWTSENRHFCSESQQSEGSKSTKISGEDLSRTEFGNEEKQEEDNGFPLKRRILLDPSAVKQVFYFDTLGLVKNLEKNGFSREQAEGVTEGFVEIIHSTLDYQTKNMVTKPQQEIMVQQLLAEIGGVKKDMVVLQKSEFTALQHDTEKQRLELKMLKDSIDDEIQKIKGKVTLDINLERGRAIEAHADSEKEVNKLHNKIDTGMANLRTMFEQYRNDVFKYAGGTVLTCASISLGLIRLWS
ncbi:mitochondrial calcium uniporter regulator 1 [Patella vulgata]|uniref:mitochondrial calcium uniporter regulator 1 n=1 Tax=Patella vulgata TaxID=6465 RepID=UPI0024A7C73C|nr:mitochondrial calcium uniporter regulator 1 [Patella vulgata]